MVYTYDEVDHKTAIESAKRLLVDSIWKEANIELISGITFPETNEILEGRVPKSADVEKVIVVNNLKQAWKFLFDQVEFRVDYQTICEYNNIIGEGGLFQYPGQLRSTIIGVSGSKYIPPIPDYSSVRNIIVAVNKIDNPIELALEMFCQITRGQWFNNGNKRTAQMVANHILLNFSAGVFAILPEDKLEFSNRLVQFYENDDSEFFKHWLYLNAIQMLPSGLSITRMKGAGVNTEKYNVPEFETKSTSKHTKKAQSIQITDIMVENVYNYAKNVYIGDIMRKDAVKAVNKESGMSEGSANDYINNYIRLRNGKSIKRMMKPRDIELFLSWIKKDEGLGEFKSACKAIKESIEYWKTINTPLNIEKVVRILEQLSK